MRVSYVVNDQPYLHPLLAWEKANRFNTMPILSLGDNFKHFDWFQEIPFSIQELEDIRVHQIAQKRDPLRLVYSGGSDSHTVAHAFARNHIPIRYSLIDFRNMQKDHIDGSSHIPNKVIRLEKLHAYYGLPKPVYEVITAGEKEIESHFHKDFHLHGAFYGCNQSFSLNQIEDNLKRSIWDPNTTTNIYGIEKPRIYQDHLGFYWQITDTMSMYTYSHDYDTTWFYLDEALPELIKVQCMSVLNVIRTRFPNEPIQKALNAFQTKSEYYLEWCIALGRQIEADWAFNSRTSKTYKSTFELPDDDRYTHLVRYQKDITLPWKNYQILFNDLKDITGSTKIEAIPTKRFYFHKDTKN